MSKAVFLVKCIGMGIFVLDAIACIINWCLKIKQSSEFFVNLIVQPAWANCWLKRMKGDGKHHQLWFIECSYGSFTRMQVISFLDNYCFVKRRSCIRGCSVNLNRKLIVDACDHPLILVSWNGIAWIIPEQKTKQGYIFAEWMKNKEWEARCVKAWNFKCLRCTNDWNFDV